jgi:hypothetical protein
MPRRRHLKAELQLTADRLCKVLPVAARGRVQEVVGLILSVAMIGHADRR